jgi:hypothetical protein
MPAKETLWRKTFFFASLYTLSAAPTLVVTYRYVPSLVFRVEALALTHNPVFDTFYYTVVLAGSEALSALRVLRRESRYAPRDATLSATSRCEVVRRRRCRRRTLARSAGGGAQLLARTSSDVVWPTA